MITIVIVIPVVAKAVIIITKVINSFLIVTIGTSRNKNNRTRNRLDNLPPRRRAPRLRHAASKLSFEGQAVEEGRLKALRV